MRKIVIGLFLTSGLLGCEKFEHSQEETIPNCVLCDHAESMVGSYRGYATGDYVPGAGDSLTLTLEQLFLGNSSFDDSTNMRFRALYNFDSSSNQYIDTIQLQDEFGYCLANVERTFTGEGEFINLGNLYLARPDSIKVFYEIFEEQNGLTYTKLRTKLYRQ